MNTDIFAALASAIRIHRSPSRRARWQIRNAGVHPVTQARELLGMPRKLFSTDDVLVALDNLSGGNEARGKGPSYTAPKPSAFAAFMQAQVAA